MLLCGLCNQNGYTYTYSSDNLSNFNTSCVLFLTYGINTTELPNCGYNQHQVSKPIMTQRATPIYVLLTQNWALSISRLKVLKML
jgi:hypothetical protein